MITAYPIDEVWPHVQPYLEKICIRQRKPPAMAYEVYDLCKKGLLCLFTNDEDSSFAAVQVRTVYDEKVLYIWAGYSVNGQRERNDRFLAELARNCGAKRIEMRSPRPGFRKTGWRVKEMTDTETVYTRTVEG